MKKASMETLVKYINDNNAAELFSIRDELTAELSKSKAKADANRTLYEEYHDKVINAMRTAGVPVTVQELVDDTGIARGKIVYGLNNYWYAEVIVDNSGKVATYKLVENYTPT